MSRSKGQYTIDGRVYRGSVNQHQILIQKEPQEIYTVLTDPDRLKQWAPFEQLSVEKLTPGELVAGSRLHFKLRFRIQPEWDSEVIHLEKGSRIVYRFLNGIFEGGIEIWDLKRKGPGTEVTHILLYKINRWVYRIGWYLLGGQRKHNELTELGLRRLKSLLEKNR